MGLNYFINPVSLGGSSFPSPAPLGTLFDVDFTTLNNLTDFTQVKPNTTISLTGGYLRAVQSPGTGTFLNYITYDSYGSSILEKWSIESIIIPRTLVVDSYGVSLGMKSTQTNRPVNDFSGFMQMNSGAGNGTVNIYNQNTTVLSTSGTLTFSVGDRIKITFTRNANVLTFTAQNLTNPNTITTSYTIAVAYGSPYFTPIIGKPTMWFHGGTQDVEYFKYSSTAMKNANATYWGDSITSEYGVPTVGDRYADKIGSTKTYNVCGSPSALSADLILCQNEITLLNSRYNVFCIGVNDQAVGTPVATSKANLQSLLASTPNTKILNYLIPFTTNNPATWNAMIDTIKQNTVVDLTTVLGTGTPKLPNATYYNADLIHPNAAGAIQIANEYALKYPELR